MKQKIDFVIFSFLALCSGGGAVFFIIQHQFFYGALFCVITLSLFFYSLQPINKIFRDINDFVEAIKYRDFSKRYAETGNNRDYLFKYFNLISDTFLSMSREKEVQHQYLEKILELVNTGILAYDKENFDILWMNDSFKNLFRISAVKNINQLKKRHPKLYKELTEIETGENRLITYNVGHRTVKTLSNATTFKTEEKTFMLIAFHNIGATLEEVESDAWKGLLNVMTHEIMNSIAPVASLADTLQQRMESMKSEIQTENIPDFEEMMFAMETIHTRSNGLLRFAETYRNLSKNIVPEIQPVNLHKLLSSIYLLMLPSLEQKGIKLEVRCAHPDVMAQIDRNLIEQVVINFITNATNAVKDKPEPHIILFSGITEEHPYLTVADNGCGISPGIHEKMFIPFFSTKKNGTGIGLSLSREIVKMHHGRLQVQSKEGEGSAFTILF